MKKIKHERTGTAGGRYPGHRAGRTGSVPAAPACYRATGRWPAVCVIGAFPMAERIECSPSSAAGHPRSTSTRGTGQSNKPAQRTPRAASSAGGTRTRTWSSSRAAGARGEVRTDHMEAAGFGTPRNSSLVAADREPRSCTSLFVCSSLFVEEPVSFHLAESWGPARGAGYKRVAWLNARWCWNSPGTRSRVSNPGKVYFPRAVCKMGHVRYYCGGPGRWRRARAGRWRVSAS